MQSRSSYLGVFFAALGLFVLSSLALPIQRAEAHRNSTKDEFVTEPLSGLSADQLATFNAGKVEFERVWEIDEGLGPLFNARSCVACHDQPDTGGAGPRYRSNFDFGLQSNQGFDPLEEEGGPLLQERGLEEIAREQVPDGANAFSLRRVPPLFGLGLVEAIPDEQIEVLADEDDANGDGISGRVGLNADGRVQRFGSQNHKDSLLSFVVGALEAEIGISEEESPSGTPTLMRSFVAFLAPVSRDEIDEEVVQGEAVFNQIGCASCHAASFTTSAGPFTTADGEVVDVAALQNQVIFPYSDFLLHSMGPELDDGVALGSAESSEYRTIPLWGLRLRGNFLHDGRAANVHQALLFHGGEAAAAREAALNLSVEDARLLKAFLESL